MRGKTKSVLCERVLMAVVKVFFVVMRLDESTVIGRHDVGRPLWREPAAGLFIRTPKFVVINRLTVMMTSTAAAAAEQGSRVGVVMIILF